MIARNTNEAVKEVIEIFDKQCFSKAPVVHVTWKNITNIDLQLYKVKVNLKLNYMTRLFT